MSPKAFMEEDQHQEEKAKKNLHKATPSPSRNEARQ